MVAGIRDKVVILGMGCSRFGERWLSRRRDDSEGESDPGESDPRESEPGERDPGEPRE